MIRTCHMAEYHVMMMTTVSMCALTHFMLCSFISFFKFTSVCLCYVMLVIGGPKITHFFIFRFGLRCGNHQYYHLLMLTLLQSCKAVLPGISARIYIDSLMIS